PPDDGKRGRTEISRRHGRAAAQGRDRPRRAGRPRTLRPARARSGFGQVRCAVGQLLRARRRPRQSARHGGVSVEERLAAAEETIAELRTEVARLNDIEAIRIVQRTYAYCMDKGLYDEVCDLFAEDGELRFMGGVWQSRESVRRLYGGRLRKLFTGGI